jgi:hypothetical protein
MDLNQNPLDMDLSAVDTSMPLLAPDIYDLQCVKAEIVKTNDGVTNMLKVQLKTTQPAKSVKSDNIGAGVVVFDQLLLAPRGKATADMVVRNVAGIVQAAGLTGARLSNVDQWHKQLEGKVVRAKVDVVPEGSRDGKSYPAKNSIGYYVKQ